MPETFQAGCDGEQRKRFRFRPKLLPEGERSRCLARPWATTAAEKGGNHALLAGNAPRAWGALHFSLPSLKTTPGSAKTLKYLSKPDAFGRYAGGRGHSVALRIRVFPRRTPQRSFWKASSVPEAELQDFSVGTSLTIEVPAAEREHIDRAAAILRSDSASLLTDALQLPRSW